MRRTGRGACCSPPTRRAALRCWSSLQHPGEENLEDRIALMGEASDDAPEREVSLRLLRHLASSVHHQQYHDTDIVTIRVEALAPRAG